MAHTEPRIVPSRGPHRDIPLPFIIPLPGSAMFEQPSSAARSKPVPGSKTNGCEPIRVRFAPLPDYCPIFLTRFGDILPVPSTPGTTGTYSAMTPPTRTTSWMLHPGPSSIMLPGVKDRRKNVQYSQKLPKYAGQRRNLTLPSPTRSVLYSKVLNNPNGITLPANHYAFQKTDRWPTPYDWLTMPAEVMCHVRTSFYPTLPLPTPRSKLSAILPKDHPLQPVLALLGIHPHQMLNFCINIPVHILEAAIRLHI